MKNLGSLLCAVMLLFACANSEAGIIHVSRSYTNEEVVEGEWNARSPGFARYIANDVSTDVGETDYIIFEDSEVYTYNIYGDGNMDFQPANSGPVVIQAATACRPVLDSSTRANWGYILMYTPIAGCRFEGITFRDEKEWVQNAGMVNVGNFSDAYDAPVFKDCIFLSPNGFAAISFTNLGNGVAGQTEIEQCAFYTVVPTDQSSPGQTINWISSTTGDWAIDKCSFVFDATPGGGFAVGYTPGTTTNVHVTNTIVDSVQQWGALLSTNGSDLEEYCFFSQIGAWNVNPADPDTNLPPGYNGSVFADVQWAGDPSTGDFTLQDTSPCLGTGEGGINIGYDQTTVLVTRDWSQY